MIPPNPLRWPAIAFPGQELLGSPGLLVLLAGAIVVTFLLYLERPRIDRRTILSLIPWMIAAATIPILAEVGDYPAAVRPLMDRTGAYLSTYLILGLSWFSMFELTVDYEARLVFPDYLGSMGIGLATSLVTLVILQGDPASIDELGWSVLILFGVAAFSVATVFALGFWYVDAPTHTGAVGMVTVFGQTLEGVARAAGLEVFDTASHSFLSWHVLDFISTYQTDASAADIAISWSVTYVWIKIAIAVLAVILLAQYAQREPARSYLVLGVIGALGLTAGVTNLLLIAIGGLP